MHQHHPPHHTATRAGGSFRPADRQEKSEVTTIPKRWTVKKKNDYWVVFEGGVAWDCFENLREAHTWATKNAVADELYAEGGLTCLSELKRGVGA
jgi:hypothetical protein